MVEWQGLSTREGATVIWALAIALWLIVWPSARRVAAPVVKSLLATWQLHVTFAVLLGWVTLWCWLGHLAHLWNSGLLKDTIAWVLIYGIGAIFSATDAAKEEHFFRRAALASLGVIPAMQFLLNLHTFPIYVELVLQPVVVVLVVLYGFESPQPGWPQAQRGIGFLLLSFNAWIFVATVMGLWHGWRGLDARQTALEFGFSIWLPLTVVPFIYVLSLLMTYETAIGMTSFRNEGKEPPLPVKVAMVAGLRGDLRAVDDLRRHPEYDDIARSHSFREGWRNVRAYRAARGARLHETEVAAARLVNNVGVKGTDDEGQQLDQREFEATKDSLLWLHVCQSIRHDNGGRYLPNVLDVIGSFEDEGLPAEHGIMMRVGKTGQCWYAWRRTVTGHVFAIGDNAHQPGQWLYDGEEPPKGYPGHDPSWGSTPLYVPPNWLGPLPSDA